MPPRERSRLWDKPGFTFLLTIFPFFYIMNFRELSRHTQDSWRGMAYELIGPEQTRITSLKLLIARGWASTFPQTDRGFLRSLDFSPLIVPTVRRLRGIYCAHCAKSLREMCWGVAQTRT